MLGRHAEKVYRLIRRRLRDEGYWKNTGDLYLAGAVQVVVRSKCSHAAINEQTAPRHV